jgi:hypothetical protein
MVAGAGLAIRECIKTARQKKAQRTQFLLARHSSTSRIRLAVTGHAGAQSMEKAHLKPRRWTARLRL